MSLHVIRQGQLPAQLRYAGRSDQGECLNDYKPGLQDRGACGQFGGPGGTYLRIDDIAETCGKQAA